MLVGEALSYSRFRSSRLTENNRGKDDDPRALRAHCLKRFSPVRDVFAQAAPTKRIGRRRRAVPLRAAVNEAFFAAGGGSRGGSTPLPLGPALSALQEKASKTQEKPLHITGLLPPSGSYVAISAMAGTIRVGSALAGCDGRRSRVRFVLDIAGDIREDTPGQEPPFLAREFASFYLDLIPSETVGIGLAVVSFVGVHISSRLGLLEQAPRCVVELEGLASHFAMSSTVDDAIEAAGCRRLGGGVYVGETPPVFSARLCSGIPGGAVGNEVLLRLILRAVFMAQGVKMRS